MFEIGLFTDEVSQELDVAIKLAKEFNIKNLEIRSVWDRGGPHKLSDEDINKIKQTIDKEGLKVICIASPFFKCDLGNKEQYKEHINILRRCIDVARKLNANIIRGLTFWRAPRETWSGLKDNWNEIIDNFKEPKKIVENEGIMLGIENEAACFIGAGRDLAKFIKEINSPNIKAIWDPANEIFDPTGENPYPDGYNHLKNLIIHVHLKDAVKKGSKNEPECVCVGEGEVDYKGQFKALINDGYNGCVSLETHWRPTRELTDELMKKPGGKVYSESGKIASKICLENLFKIINNLDSSSSTRDKVEEVLKTKRERYLKALRNEEIDRFVFAPNFDYWLSVNTAEGTLPDCYKGMSRNDIVRSMDATIWARVQGLKEEYDGVIVKELNEGTSLRKIWETPVGTVDCLYVESEGPHRSKFLKEHRIKKHEDIRIVKYIVESTKYISCYDKVEEMMRDVEEDGITLTCSSCVPFIQFGKEDAGWENGLYMLEDYKNEVEEFLKVYEDKYAEGYKILADLPAPVVATGDNMDECMTSPELFKRYAIPFYQRMSEILHSKGKLFEGHWCGRTKNLLNLVPGCGLDIVEAIVTKPMADITILEALERLEGKVVMQGGIPSVLMCEQGCTRDEFIKYIEKLIEDVKGKKGFVLGLSDNVPPDADFERVKIVSDIVNSKRR